MQVKKPGRKHAKEKQEEIAGKEKKLGTQTTIENSMGTSIKSIKNHGHTVPPQGGDQNQQVNNDHFLLEL
jgi:hypothetical protein